MNDYICFYYLSSKIYSYKKIVIFPKWTLSYFVKALNMILIGLSKVQMQVCRIHVFSPLCQIDMIFFLELLLQLDYLILFTHRKCKYTIWTAFSPNVKLLHNIPTVRLQAPHLWNSNLTSCHIRWTLRFSDTCDKLIHVYTTYFLQKSCNL